MPTIPTRTAWGGVRSSSKAGPESLSRIPRRRHPAFRMSCASTRKDMLSSSLDVREARFTLVPGGGPAADEPARNLATGDYSFGSNGYVGRLYNWLNSLISFDSPSPTVILISLLAALLWGAVHAFTPGHGKTVVAAYLIGDRGTARHAAFLGLTVTLTHTVGVFALGGVAIYLSRYILPEALFPWLGTVSRTSGGRDRPLAPLQPRTHPGSRESASNGTRARPRRPLLS